MGKNIETKFKLFLSFILKSLQCLGFCLTDQIIFILLLSDHEAKIIDGHKVDETNNTVLSTKTIRFGFTFI